MKSFTILAASVSLILLSSASFSSGQLKASVVNSLQSIEGVTAYQVFQRNDHNMGTIPFHGTLAQPVDGKIEARILKGSTAVINWKVSGRCDKGSFSGEVSSVPVGGEYTLQLRFPGGFTHGISNLLVGDLWIMAGQSNMDGAGKLVHLEDPDPHVHCFFKDDHWDIAKDPLVLPNRAVDPAQWTLPADKREEALKRQKYFLSNGAGLGVRFGKDLFQNTGVPVGMIPCSLGGTSMAQWDPSRINEGGNSLYGAMYRRFKAVGGKVAGVLWYQGEADSKPDRTIVYKEKMHNLVDSIRRDFNQPDLPFIYAQLSITTYEPKAIPEWNTIQQLQLELEKELKNAAMVVTADLTLSDPLHLDSVSQRMVGARMAYDARILRFKEKNLAIGPRPVDFQLDSQRKTLRIFFQGLNGSLKPVSRLQGILVESGGYVPIESFEIKGNQVVLHFLTSLGPNAKLSYGKGFNPVINLYDSANMPVPIFGPVTLP